MSTQTPEINNSAAHAAGGNLAFLLSVIRCGESLSPDEEQNVREVIQRLDLEEGFTCHLMARHGTVCNAVRLLIEQIERVHNDSRYRTVWEIAQLYLGQYEGATYEGELNALKDLLGMGVLEDDGRQAS